VKKGFTPVLMTTNFSPCHKAIEYLDNYSHFLQKCINLWFSLKKVPKNQYMDALIILFISKHINFLTTVTLQLSVCNKTMKVTIFSCEKYVTCSGMCISEGLNTE